MSLRDKVGHFFFTCRRFTQDTRTGRILYKTLRGAAVMLGIFFLLNVFFPVHADIEYSQIVTAADGTVMTAYLTTDDKWRMMTELSEITPDMQKAIVFKEDRYFRYHPGVNPASIARAIYNNIRTGTRTSGASTITMQVARMLSPKDRTYANKLTEMFRALQLDMLYSKDEILQMYLNLVPYGGNIEGVKAASVLYLEKNPEILSLAELTALSIIPNRPTSLRPGVNNDVIVRERNKWLERFRSAGIFPNEVIDDALAEPFKAFRTEGPAMARHFCARMRSDHPGIPIVKTTIQPEIQQQCETALQNYVRQLWALDIQNGAALVIDNKTHAIVAYVGSADFFNARDGGQVDGVQAVRSPGSTLKPLLYAMAFDAGSITPQSMIADVPVNYSGYSPSNYDETFHGNISITNALANSLNIPAVRTLHSMGINGFLDKLELSGFQAIADKRNELGLSVALGGCGVTLEELTRLYSSFALGGEQYRPVYLQNDTTGQKFRICSEASAFMITEVLSQLTRPDLPAYYQHAKNVPHIAWKTGTSFGRKDAWSIGYNADYTIGVWVGNFSGKGIPELSGAQIATPLLFNIFHAIGTDVGADWNRMPESVQFRYVCDAGGKVPSEHCTNVVMDYFIPGVSRNDTCSHVTEIAVDMQEKYSYCTSCIPEAGYKHKLYEDLSGELIAWREDHHIPFDRIPPHWPECERIFEENAPVIISPVHQMEYLLEKEDPQQIMLQANAAGDVERVFWFVNDKLLTSASPDDPVFFTPTEGLTRIVCADDHGRNAKLEFTVDFF